MKNDLTAFAISAQNPTYPEPIRERLRVVADSAQSNMDAINRRLAPRFKSIERRGNAILNAPMSTTKKIYAIWAICDELNSENGKNVACRRGCSHCCHIAVAITPEEAEAIGKRIGRAPRKDVTLCRNPSEGFDFGYDNPCTFLKDGECSIYEHRPLACRAHFSLDVDALLCELHPPESSPVPLLNPKNVNMLLVYAINPTDEKSLADIREYFPPKK